MTKELPGVSERRSFRYLKTMDRLKDLKGIERINEFFAFNPNDPNNPHPRGKPGKRRGTIFKHKQHIVKASRKRNRP